MIIIRQRQKQNDGAYTILNDQALITKDNKVEFMLPQMPLKDIAILLDIKEEDIKRVYRGISEYFDYQTVVLFLESDMLNLNYFKQYHLISFNSALCINVYYDSEKRDLKNNPDYIPIPLAALILHITEERMLNLARLEESVVQDEDTKQHYMKSKDFLDCYKRFLFNIGIEADITLSQKNDCISVLIERKLNDKTEIK